MKRRTPRLGSAFGRGTSGRGRGALGFLGTLLGTPDPTLLTQVDLTAPTTMLTANYTALNTLDLRNQALGFSWSDPHTGATLIKGSTITYPHSSSKSNNYGDGGNYGSHAWQDGSGNWFITWDVFSGGNSQSWLVDIQLTGVGANSLSNWRQLTGALQPSGDLRFSFSGNRSTPRIAYVLSGSTIRKINTQTMTEVVGGNFPKTIASGSTWLHQDRLDKWFVYVQGSTVFAWDSVNNVVKQCSQTANEGRVNREGDGRVFLTASGGGGRIWDAEASNPTGTSVFLNTMVAGPGGWQHNASMRNCWLGTNWDLSAPWGVWRWSLSGSTVTVNTNLRYNSFYGGNETHWCGNWDQDISGGIGNQWAVCYGTADISALYPGNDRNFARRAVGFIKADGTDARLLAFHQAMDYTSGSSGGIDNYWLIPFTCISAGGHVVAWSTRWTTGENTNPQNPCDIVFAIVPRSGGL